MRRALSVYEEYRLVPSNQASSESFVVRRLRPDLQTRENHSKSARSSRATKSSLTFSRGEVARAPVCDATRLETRAGFSTRSPRTAKVVRNAKPKKRTRSKTKPQKPDATDATLADSTTELIATQRRGRKEKEKEQRKAASAPERSASAKKEGSKSSKRLRGKARTKSAAVGATKCSHAPVRSASCLGYPVLDSLHVDSDVINAVGAANALDALDRWDFYFALQSCFVPVHY